MPRGSGRSPDGEGSGNRPRYRDNDDVRAPLSAAQRMESDPDTKSEARGKARENVGRTARGTAARPTGPEGNDKTKRRDAR